MKPPKCRVCLSEHFGAAHIWKGEVPSERSKPTVVHMVVHKTNGSSRHGKYADAEARKAYRREWMKKRRDVKNAKVRKSSPYGEAAAKSDCC